MIIKKDCAGVYRIGEISLIEIIVVVIIVGILAACVIARKSKTGKEQVTSRAACTVTCLRCGHTFELKVGD